MTATQVRHRLVTPDGEPIQGRRLIARLIAPTAWLADHTGEVVDVATATSGDDGWCTLKLTPQSAIAASGSYYEVRLHPGTTVRTCVVPDAGPVQLATILVDPTTLTPTPVPPASVFVLTGDPRLSDTRTPKPHAASHGSGGSDPITPASIGAIPVPTGGAQVGQVVAVSAVSGGAPSGFGLVGAPSSGEVASTTAGAGIVVKGAAARLPLPTPDGNTGAVTHPSVYFKPDGWNGKRYWMAATPYYNATVAYENPCIWHSDDGDNWTVPTGLTNPIEPAPVPANDYNSDTHLIEGPDGRLYCFWRSYYPSAPGTEERIFYRASSNGVDWSDRQTVLTNNKATRRLVSPAITYDSGVWTMWAVDIVPSPNTVVRMTATSPTGPWSAPQTCTGLSAPNGRDVWHLDVHRIGSEYVLLFCDAALDSSTGGVLFRAVSRNGLAWTQDASPFLMPVGNRWDSLLYRACLLPARVNGSDGYEVWYSSAQSPNWGVARTVAQIVPTRPRQDDPLNLTAANGLYPGWYLGDVVARADSTTSPGTATSGQTWTVDAGTLGIQGRRIYAPAAANSRATINLGVGVVDCEVGATAPVLPSPTGQTWVVARYVDASNFIRAGLNNGVWMIQEVTAGTATTIASLGATAALAAPAPGDRFALRCKGTAVELLVNERLIATATVTAQLTGTSVGVQTQNVDTRFAAIYAKAA